MNARRNHRTLIFLTLAYTLLTPNTHLAAADLIPEDECRLELTLPPGTQVTLDDRDMGQQTTATRGFNYAKQKAGNWRERSLTLRFPSGEHHQQTLMLRGGERVRLAMLDPAKPRPEPVLQTGHTDWVNSVAFSPDGRQILTGSDDKTAILWDVATGKKLRTFQGHTDSVSSVAFSPDGRQILTGSDDKTAILWDVATGKKLRTFQGHTDWVNSVAFSPDGQQILTGSEDATAILWDVATGKKLRTFEMADTVCSVAFSPDGRQILTGGDDTAILWDVATGKKLRTFEGHTYLVTSVAFSPDGRQILTGSEDGNAILWDVATGKKLRTFEGHTRWVKSVAFSPDGRQILTGSWDDTAILWDVATGKKLRTFVGHTSAVTSVAFSPDGRQILTGSDDETAALWDVATGKRLRTFEGHTGYVESVAFSPDGRQILTGSWDNTAILWDVATGKKLRTFEGHESPVTSVAFSPDGRQILTGSWDDTAILWDVATGKKLRTFEGHKSYVNSVAFSPDGRQILTGSSDKTAILWDVATGKKLRTFEGHTESVKSVAFSPDGRQILTGSWDETAILWDVATGKRLRTFQGHKYWLTSVAFSPDGRQILTGSWDHTAILWDVATGKRLRTFVGHTDRVNSVAFSPDGRQILTGSQDDTAILWDVATGKKLRTFEGHTNDVESVAFRPDGRHILTGSEDGTTIFWDIATGERVLQIISLDGGNDWLVTTPEGLFDGSAGGRNRMMYRVGGGLNVVPVDRFYQDFYRPGLMASIGRGERPLPGVEIGKSLPPRLALVSPQSGVMHERTIVLDVRAEDKGGGVKGPMLFHQGSRVVVSEKPTRQGNIVRWRPTVSLVQGENQLVIKSASADGSWESEPVAISLRYAKPLAQSRLYVLGVGIDAYREERMKLDFASADARAVVDLFESRGETLYGKGRVFGGVLIDGRATKASIQKTLGSVASRSEPQDVFILHLAGHGHMVGQRYYFIPYEFERTEASVDDDVRRQGIAGDELDEWIARIPALKRIVIYDTCQSGGAIGKLGKARDPFSFEKALETMSRRQGSYIIAAAPAGDKAQEIKDLGHGVLTYSLLAGLGAVDDGPLRGKALPPVGEDATVGVRDWLTYAQDKVPLLTELYIGEKQFVKYTGEGQNFPILPAKK